MIIRLAFVIVALLSVAARVYYALSDGSLVSIGFGAGVAIDALFLAAALGLLFNQPLVGRTFWRIIFLIYGSVIVATFCFAAFLILTNLGSLPLDEMEAPALLWFAINLAEFLILYLGLFLYVYRSPSIWAQRQLPQPRSSGTLA